MVERERETRDHWRPKFEFGKVYSAQLDAKMVSIKMNIRTKWERILGSLSRVRPSTDLTDAQSHGGIQSMR